MRYRSKKKMMSCVWNCKCTWLKHEIVKFIAQNKKKSIKYIRKKNKNAHASECFRWFLKCIAGGAVIKWWIIFLCCVWMNEKKNTRKYVCSEWKVQVEYKSKCSSFNCSFNPTWKTFLASQIFLLFCRKCIWCWICEYLCLFLFLYFQPTLFWRTKNEFFVEKLFVEWNCYFWTN